MSKKNSCYITTPIYYVTAKPHLGSLYSTLLADVFTRWYALQGYKTFLLTGTDEHGQKIAQAAEAAGMQPKMFVDSFIHDYKHAWKTFEIDYSYFIRTTDQDHVQAVQYWLQQLIAKGDIYKAYYEGWYCVPCETFITEHDIAEQRNAGLNPHCISCKRPVNQIKEETYFFKLSAYQEKLLAFYEAHKDFIVPQERAHEIINFVKAGLKDISISRNTISWGIPFPGDTQHVTYVWADALNNYITAVGYGKKGQEGSFKQWWPATLQILGKDIVRFHAIYWPAFLMASELPLPEQLLVHGWIQVDKQKMSKSLGNVIDPMLLHEQYGTEPVRYYLMRYMAITQDSNFSIADLQQAITADLANDLGNLLNRMTSLAEKYNITVIQSSDICSERALHIINEGKTVIQDVENYMRERLVHMALSRVWKYIHSVNAYFHAYEPWKLAKTDMKAFTEVLAVTCNGLHVIAVLLWPVMPAMMEQLLASIGLSLTVTQEYNAVQDLTAHLKGQTFMLKKIDTLFQKYEAVPAAAEQSSQVKPQQDAMDYITIDDVAKVHLAAGTILSCDEVSGSDKLYRLMIDFGSHGQRQILAGIKKAYRPDELVAKQVVCVINLKPRMMLGLESQGMVLAALNEQGDPMVTSPFKPVPNGTRLK